MEVANERGPSHSIAPSPKAHELSLSLYNPETGDSLGVLGKDYFLVEFEENDPEEPCNWPEHRKWFQVGLMLIATLMYPVNGTSITIAAEDISREFNILDTQYFTNSFWPVTSWTLGGGAMVVFGLPFLEDFGVYAGFNALNAIFVPMIIPQALAKNFATLVVTRVITGGCVAVQANSISSVIAELWTTEKARTLPVSLYILFYTLGDSAGPAMFAGVIQYIGNWRWIFYIQLIVYGALYPVFLYFLRETRPDIILRKRAKRIRKETGRPVYHESELNKLPALETLKRSAYRPLYMLLTEPVLFASTLWSAFALGLVFLFTQSVEQVFMGLYGWTEYQCGYVQGFILAGELLGWMAALYGQRFFFASAKRNTEFPGEPIPEARLYTSIVGSFGGIAGGMFVYAWTAYPSIPWYAPALGLLMVGFGIEIVVYAAAEYVTDAYADSGYTGSALSAVAFGENILCGFLPLASQSMYTNLGFQWASTLLACLSILLSLAPVIFIWKGQQLRERSPFMRSANKNYVNQSSGITTPAPETTET